MSLPFLKMNGAGNDFIIFREPVDLTPQQVRQLADRENAATKGCDQVIVMAPSGKADIFMRIYNADGGEVASCGNATRCVAWLLDKEKTSIETSAGILQCERARDRVRVDMGEPKFGWRDIPLSEESDTLKLPIYIPSPHRGEVGRGASEESSSDTRPHPNPPPKGEGMAVSMGNPHMIFVVDDVKKTPVRNLGPKLETHPLFPERANVNFAQVVSPDRIQLRVWERGAGETLACGTGACATLVALNRRGLVGDKAAVELPGGILEIEWDKTANRVFMTGPVELEFEGAVEL